MTNREKLFEAVARAVWHRNVGYKRVPWDALDVEDQDVFRAYARAALAAIEASGTHRVVSVELVQAATDLLYELDTDDVGGLVEGQMERLRRILSAAPKVTP